MRLIFAVFLLGLLAGCSKLGDKELPENPSGTDELRPSPCACQQLDYKPEGYKWLG